jgi:hypothetical protein
MTIKKKPKKYGKTYSSVTKEGKDIITSESPHRKPPEDLPDFIPKSSFTPEQWEEAKKTIGRGEFVTAPEKQISEKPKVSSQEKQKPEISPLYQGAFAFAHPFKTLFAATNPNITIEEASREFYGQSLGRQITDIGLATLGYGTAIAGGAMAFGARAGVGAGAKAGTATITRTATKISGARKGTSLTAQRAFVGKPATTGINKIFHKTRPIASKYATNVKSNTLTKGFLIKTGLSLSATGILVGAIGSYPFAGFIKEEAVQTLSIPIKDAIYNNDLEGARMQTEAIDEILNAQSTLADKIPYVNVLKNLNDFFDAARTSNEQWKKTIALKGGRTNG